MNNSATANNDRAISDNKRRIMKISAELFAERGYGGVGTSEIGQATGFGKGALYHHIRSKEDLLFDIMTVYMQDLLQNAKSVLAAEKDTRARIKALSEALMRAVVQDKAQMTVCFREVHALSEEKRRTVLRLHGDYYRIWKTVVADATASGEFRRVTSVELKGLLGMYFYSFLWISDEEAADIDAIARKFAGIVLRACSNT